MVEAERASALFKAARMKRETSPWTEFSVREGSLHAVEAMGYIPMQGIAGSDHHLAAGH